MAKVTSSSSMLYPPNLETSAERGHLFLKSSSSYPGLKVDQMALLNQSPLGVWDALIGQDLDWGKEWILTD